ncbi:MAG: hypothetical protein AAGI71_13180 [Bacteroidota bacterium]
MRLFAWIILAGCVLAAPSAHADGWTQRKQSGFYKVNFRFVSAGSFYERSGTQIDIPTLRDYTVSFYGEYGLTDRLTAFAYVPFFERITLNEQVGTETGFVFFEGDAVSGVADPDIGLRYGLVTQGPVVLSASLRFGLPIGRDEQPNGLLTGDGEFNQHLALEAGYSLYPVPAYAVASLGFNNRTGGFSDEVIYGIEAGYTVGVWLTLIGRLRGVESLKNGEDGTLGGGSGLYANNQRFLSPGVEVLVTPQTGYGVSLGVDGAFFGENVLAAPAFSLGVFMSR